MSDHTLLPLAALLLGVPVLLGAQVPPAGDDYHVPLFVRDMGAFWETRVLGETAVARDDTPAAAALISATLGRCPDVSTLVFEPVSDAPWERTAAMLIAVQGTKRTVALRGDVTDQGLTGTGLITSEAKLPKASSRHVVVRLTDDKLMVGERMVCELQPNTPLCEGSLAGVRVALGGQPAVLHASPGVPTGVVMTLAGALLDHELHYGVMGTKGELRTFEVTLLQGRVPWVQQACDKPLHQP